MKNSMLLKKLVPAIVLVTLSTSFVFGQSSMQDTHKIKQMFMYHFLKYTQWPDDASSDEFVIGVVGDEKMYEALKNTFDQGKRKSRTYNVKFFANVEAISETEVVFLSSAYSHKFEDALLKVEGKNTLLITEKNGLGAQGSGINFKAQGNKLQFELNLKALEKAGLKVAGQLTQVAILL